MENHPKIGIGVMIWKENKILLGKRKNAHGAGEYSFPGGRLEYAETLKDCARRETREETGLEIENIRFNYLADEHEHMPKHFVHIGFIADWKNGEPQTLEPEKCEGWNWYAIDQLPDPLFLKTKTAIDAFISGTKFLDMEIEQK